jgi:hypothetical protein
MTRLAFLSKDLNEISEHATNIAEVVIFMVDGKEIMHMACTSGGWSSEGLSAMETPEANG